MVITNKLSHIKAALTSLSLKRIKFENIFLKGLENYSQWHKIALTIPVKPNWSGRGAGA
jgi:hypothetical protein